ncbi:hypothetical protein FM112_00435 [Gulosibacter sp. 10]|nr:hypothetical protein FM112_00435 [Gulosibacter sp. 10]
MPQRLGFVHSSVQGRAERWGAPRRRVGSVLRAVANDSILVSGHPAGEPRPPSRRTEHRAEDRRPRPAS